MDYAVLFDPINAAFVWDGWRALAAIGTMAAVWIALNRDTAAEKRQSIRDAHVIGAMLAEVNYVLLEAEEYERARKSKKLLLNFFSGIDKANHLPTSQKFFDNIKLSDCPTVEVMTTVGVLSGLIQSIVSKIEGARNCIEPNLSGFSPQSEMQLEIKALRMCQKDLEAEQRWVAGRYYKSATQDGHRKLVEKRTGISPRHQSLKYIPQLIRTIITNRMPERKFER